MLDFLGGIIAYPFRWIDAISPNYVITLILFAILMKIILFPFSIKQQKNSVKQAKLRPYETIIRRKYEGKTDNESKQKMNQEIMELYQKEGYNPASGCLPMLLQLPILLSLYQVIIKPATFLLQFPKEIITKLGEAAKLIDGKAVTEIVQINKVLSADTSVLEADAAKQVAELLATEVAVKGETVSVQAAFENLKNSFDIFGINLMDTPTLGFNLLIIIPILVLIFSWGSMKLTRKFTYQPSVGQDNATKSSMFMMDITMPLMSAWICFMTPAAIGIYWIIQNILGVVQQYALYKMFPIPPVTEEDMKEAERVMRGKPAKKPKKPVIEAEAAEVIEAKNAPAKKKKVVSSKTKISGHGKARIKAHGTVPVATRRMPASRKAKK